MNYHRVFIGPALTLLLALAPTACNTERVESPLAEDGSIDLSTWDFATQGLAKLDGNFGFAWQKVLEPMALENLKRQRSRHEKISVVTASTQSSGLS